MKTITAGSNKKVLTYDLSEPLKDATTAMIDIHPGDGNLTIDGLTGGEKVLANGTLQYLERNGLPIHTLVPSNGQAKLTLRGGSSGQPWFHFPWSACNGATEWQIHLNPKVTSDITAHSDGGNLKLMLAGMAVTRVSADTGGGNIDVVLPDNTANLSVIVKSGAGNVTIQIPDGIEANIHAASGLGKVIMDQRFNKIDKITYQSDGYDGAASRVEITANTGAGNVIVSTKI